MGALNAALAGQTHFTTNRTTGAVCDLTGPGQKSFVCFTTKPQKVCFSLTRWLALSRAPWVRTS